MSLYTRDKVYLSADRGTYWQYDKGTGLVSLYVDNTLVWTADSSEVTTVADAVKTGVQRVYNGFCKVGATAGFAVGGGAVNTGLMATCPAGQTASTLVVPLAGVLNVGDTITAVHLVGQIESAGNTVTIDVNLRKMTTAAADVADASVASMTQISVTADTAISSANGAIGSLTEVVAADETFYLLITVTTGASTDVALQGAIVTVTTAS